MSFAACLVRVGQPLSRETAAFLAPLAPQEKLNRIARQRSQQHADNMLVGAALARWLLWREFRIPPGAEIAYTSDGKPYLKDEPGVWFNISHSGQYVACAVCDNPVGIDIQMIVPYRPDTARRVCSAAELKMLENSRVPDVDFIKLWTQKEAYLKMLGYGITRGWPDTTKLTGLQVIEHEECIVAIAKKKEVVGAAELGAF